MKHLLNRLLVTDSGTGTTDETDDSSGGSDSVEWRDISIRTNGPTGSASNIDPEEPSPSTAETSFGTLAADQLVGSILDAVTVPMLVVDRAGKIVAINTAACELFETTESTAIGTTSPAVHGGQRLLGQLLLTGEGITDQQETVVVDGTTLTIRRTLTPLRDDRDEIVGAVETVRDGSETTR